MMKFPFDPKFVQSYDQSISQSPPAVNLGVWLIPVPLLSSRTFRATGAVEAAGVLAAGLLEPPEWLPLAAMLMMTTRTISPRQPIAPFRRPCPFFLISYPDGSCCCCGAIGTGCAEAVACIGTQRCPSQ